MRWALIVIGALMDLFGTVWMLQGLNILPGSFMTGDMTWFWNGLVLDIVGLVVLVAGIRRGGAKTEA